ncbi:Polyprenyl synthetase-related protein [Ophiocordyceps sinensis CO18]|uniref:Polyprenyl synthetase-related protein n=1 Tax=Ophiocordyceps sinensis (strain Co18 / CGMCC 3.14243) TaxID=911162 RepID=T5A7L7_OPHSC|nr:Polyprenyl synthetase-related protein [Ophiocordyceps sinensis CO18]
MCNLSPPSRLAADADADADIAPAVPNYNLGNPNAIPPRTSSTGLHARAGHLSSSFSHQPFASPPSVLRPVSEGDWLSQKKQQTTSWLSPAADMTLTQQHQAQQPAEPEPALDVDRSSWAYLSTSSPSPPSTWTGRRGRICPRRARARPRRGQVVVVVGVSVHVEPEPALDVDRSAHDDLHFAPERSWTRGKEKVVRAPYDYAISHPGKDFRSQVISAFDAWLQVPPSSLHVITKVIAILHESSLLLDDVQDSSELRRGFPVAHNIFGVPQTINSANYMSFVALRELQDLHSPRAISVFAEELVNLYRGQGMDLFWRDTLTCPTEDDYLEMVSNKTGGMFRLGIKLMQAESAANMDCVPLVNLVGLIFQIRDDYMNLSSSEYTDNKGMCEDLTEGKFSFPIIHCIRSDSSNLRLVNILRQKTTDLQVKRYAVSHMESTGSFAYTRRVLATLIDRARKLALELDAGQNRAHGILRILDKMVVE